MYEFTMPNYLYITILAVDSLARSITNFEYLYEKYPFYSANTFGMSFTYHDLRTSSTSFLAGIHPYIKALRREL